MRQRQRFVEDLAATATATEDRKTAETRELLRKLGTESPELKALREGNSVPAESAGNAPPKAQFIELDDSVELKLIPLPLGAPIENSAAVEDEEWMNGKHDYEAPDLYSVPQNIRGELHQL